LETDPATLDNERGSIVEIAMILGDTLVGMKWGDIPDLSCRLCKHRPQLTVRAIVDEALRAKKARRSTIYI
jgi:hypothetical protein